jgi:hypothetical protein
LNVDANALTGHRCYALEHRNRRAHLRDALCQGGGVYFAGGNGHILRADFVWRGRKEERQAATDAGVDPENTGFDHSHERPPKLWGRPARY